MTPNTEDSGAPTDPTLKDESSKIENLINELRSVIAADLTRVIADHVRKQREQYEAYQQVTMFLQDGLYPLSFHGWPVSPDFALQLAKLIAANNYDLIVEFGSGTSTVVVSKAIESKKKSGSALPIFVSFEHSDRYHKATSAQLKQRGLEQFVNIKSCPLTNVPVPNAGGRQFYDCGATLKELGSTPYRHVLVVVDGPPAATAAEARYPALPLILKWIKSEQMDILLDDFDRDDERQICQKWLQHLKPLYTQRKLAQLDFEKGAALITVSEPIHSGDERHVNTNTER